MISTRKRSFIRSVHQTYPHSVDVLLTIIRNKAHSSLSFRAGALRNLVWQAPLTVTQGRPYLERRRAVRKHYAV